MPVFLFVHPHNCIPADSTAHCGQLSVGADVAQREIGYAKEKVVSSPKAYTCMLKKNRFRLDANARHRRRSGYFAYAYKSRNVLGGTTVFGADGSDERLEPGTTGPPAGNRPRRRDQHVRARDDGRGNSERRKPVGRPRARIETVRRSGKPSPSRRVFRSPFSRRPRTNSRPDETGNPPGKRDRFRTWNISRGTPARHDARSFLRSPQIQRTPLIIGRAASTHAHHTTDFRGGACDDDVFGIVRRSVDRPANVRRTLSDTSVHVRRQSGTPREFERDRNTLRWNPSYGADKGMLPDNTRHSAAMFAFAGIPHVYETRNPVRSAFPEPWSAASVPRGGRPCALVRKYWSNWCSMPT